MKDDMSYWENIFAGEWLHCLLCITTIPFGNDQKSVGISAIHSDGKWYTVCVYFDILCSFI